MSLSSMLTHEIRQQFLRYFQKNAHKQIPSSPVIPHDDPTLLFINAGMNQFKDFFLGNAPSPYPRAVTCQKCIRAGGKHNDLENVGHTSRHLTFFEMLGNFSFGDYFKKDAIAFAWQVATEVFQFAPERIWPTVFEDDDEAFELWRSYVPEERISRMGEKENFWSMGDTGPCGPCSELLFDRGPEFGPAHNPQQDTAGERFFEFWNLVFMQYDRQPDGSIISLPRPSIDTGAGIERIAALQMGARSVFETDILRALIDQVEKVSGVAYRQNDPSSAAFHVIADHLRSLCFAIADGAQPSNVDRGYVLRKILRRALRYGRQLGLMQPFLACLLPRLVQTMGDFYHELATAQDRIQEILTLEEESFIRTLKRGGNLLSGVLQNASEDKKISGEDAHFLKDTYGMPFDEIVLVARDSGLTVDKRRFDALEKEAKERSRSKKKQAVNSENAGDFTAALTSLPPTQFLGYDKTALDGVVLMTMIDNQESPHLAQGQQGWVVLDKTCFYAEKGGQVGDAGALSDLGTLFDVQETKELAPGIIGHFGLMQKGAIKKGQALQAAVDEKRRLQTANNHTATHLLHWALQECLGQHIRQAGSLVDAARLRFDFSHHKALDAEEIRLIEDLVNEKVRENTPLKAYEVLYEEVQKQRSIKQFFGDKYGPTVRVVDIGYSKELCGGTHAKRTGDIGYFRIQKESSIGAGVRRIEAVSGQAAENFARQMQQTLEEAAASIKTSPDNLAAKLASLVDQVREKDKELLEVQKKSLLQTTRLLASHSVEKKGVRYLVQEVSVAPCHLKDLSDLLLQEARLDVLFLVTAANQTCSLLMRVPSDLMAARFPAHDLLKAVCPIVEGTGGGKATMAQGGGKAIGNIALLLQKMREAIEQRC